MAGEKILIVDDEQGVIDVLMPAFRNRGYEVLSAENGLSGFKKIIENQPNIVLLDIKMPKVDGYNLCHMIKRDERLRRIPVIMLTAKTQKADILEGKKSGADAYITKPFDVKDVLAMVEKHLGQSS